MQDLLSAWKSDAKLPLVQQNEDSKVTGLADQIPGFENMKSLKEIFKAAKSLRAMSTRKERQALKDAAADAARLAAADFDLARKEQEAAKVLKDAMVIDQFRAFIRESCNYL